MPSRVEVDPVATQDVFIVLEERVRFVEEADLGQRGGPHRAYIKTWSGHTNTLEATAVLLTAGAGRREADGRGAGAETPIDRLITSIEKQPLVRPPARPLPAPTTVPMTVAHVPAQMAILSPIIPITTHPFAALLIALPPTTPITATISLRLAPARLTLLGKTTPLSSKTLILAS